MSAAALRELEAAIAVFDVDGPVTWGQLQEKVAEAARAAEQDEWEQRMGDDL